MNVDLKEVESKKTSYLMQFIIEALLAIEFVYSCTNRCCANLLKYPDCMEGGRKRHVCGKGVPLVVLVAAAAQRDRNRCMISSAWSGQG
jgi:hypothetical protein